MVDTSIRVAAGLHWETQGNNWMAGIGFNIRKSFSRIKNLSLKILSIHCSCGLTCTWFVAFPSSQVSDEASFSLRRRVASLVTLDFTCINRRRTSHLQSPLYRPLSQHSEALRTNGKESRLLETTILTPPIPCILIYSSRIEDPSSWP